MESNPYSAPQHIPETKRSSVTTPAICLLVVATVCVAIVLMGLMFDVVLLTTGMARTIAQATGDDQLVDVYVRIAWSIVLLVASSFVMYAALQMWRRQNYALAYAGAVVASVPCVGPCCVLGIPFGVWALVVLHRTEIRQEFDGDPTW